MALKTGTPGDDTLIGTSRADTLKGGKGNDLLVGRGGADTLNGGAGSDSISAGSGDDRIIGSRGADQINGGTGFDTLDFRQAAGSVEVWGPSIISTSYADAPAFGPRWTGTQKVTGIEVILGSGFNDRIVIFSEDVTVKGGKGADFIRASHALGGRGNDVLSGDLTKGGRGHDRLSGDTAFGGQGDDIIESMTATGGGGADTFVFEDRKVFDTTLDHVITDFDGNAGDVIAFTLADGAAFVRYFGFVNFAAMMSNTSDINGEAVIDWGEGTLTIEGVTKDQLQASWFDFTDLV